MVDDSGRAKSRALVGFLVLVAALVLAGVIVVATQLVEGGGAWLIQTFVAVGLLAVALYVTLVLRPQLREEQQIQADREQHARETDALKASFAELRQGDLVAMAERSEGIAAELTSAVEVAARSLGGLIQQIQSSSVEVASSAQVVQETSAELASGSSEQAAAVVEITATMEELARTAGQIAANASAQAELAARAESEGNDGAEAVGGAVDGVEAVRVRMEAIANRADTLGSRSREIYRVLDLITDIAQETHVLALNAAIEATAAGSHGDRFGVVAAEVRRLAERSRESVDSIRVLLDEFSSAIRSMVVATEEGSKSAVDVLERSRAAESAIEELRRALETTARTAREISLATEEQRTASDQVVMTLREVSEVIQRMASGLNQFSGAAERLNHLALSIQLLSQSFRLESVHSLKHQALALAEGLADFSGNLEAVEGSLEDGLRALPYLELIYLVDTRGGMVAYVANRDVIGEDRMAGSVIVGQLYADRPWFQAVMRTGRTAVTPLYESLLTGDPCFTIAAGVHDEDGGMVGVLGLDVNARNWTRI